MSDEILKKHSPTVYREFRQHDVMREKHGKLDSECPHTFWTKKCSMCRAILESDSKINLKEGNKTKLQYSDLERLVCKYSYANKIKELKVQQKSKLYWVYNEENDVVFLRSYENVLSKNNSVSSAFTSSELVTLFNRLPDGIVSDEEYLYIGKNANEPNRLAKLYIKLKRQYEDDKNSI